MTQIVAFRSSDTDGNGALAHWRKPFVHLTFMVALFLSGTDGCLSLILHCWMLFFHLILMITFLSYCIDGSLFVHLAMKVTVLSSGTYGSLSPWTDVSLFVFIWHL